MKTERKTKFANRADAWKFMYGCDDAGIMAGFPEPVKGGGYTVAWIPKA